MAYSDSLRSISATREDVADKIDGLIPIPTTANTASIQSTSSSSYLDMSGSPLTIIAPTDGLIWIQYVVSLSAGAAAKRAAFQCTIDSSSTIGQECYWTSIATNTNGDEQTLTLNFVSDSPGAGTHTYRLQWKSSDGTTTIYSAHLQSNCLTFQTS